MILTAPQTSTTARMVRGTFNLVEFYDRIGPFLLRRRKCRRNGARRMHRIKPYSQAPKSRVQVTPVTAFGDHFRFSDRCKGGNSHLASFDSVPEPSLRETRTSVRLRRDRLEACSSQPSATTLGPLLQYFSPGRFRASASDVEHEPVLISAASLRRVYPCRQGPITTMRHPRFRKKVR